VQIYGQLLSWKNLLYSRKHCTASQSQVYTKVENKQELPGMTWPAHSPTTTVHANYVICAVLNYYRYCVLQDKTKNISLPNRVQSITATSSMDSEHATLDESR